MKILLFISSVVFVLLYIVYRKGARALRREAEEERRMARMKKLEYERKQRALAPKKPHSIINNFKSIKTVVGLIRRYNHLKGVKVKFEVPTDSKSLREWKQKLLRCILMRRALRTIYVLSRNFNEQSNTCVIGGFTFIFKEKLLWSETTFRIQFKKDLSQVHYNVIVVEHGLFDTNDETRGLSSCAEAAVWSEAYLNALFNHLERESKFLYDKIMKDKQVKKYLLDEDVNYLR